MQTVVLSHDVAHPVCTRLRQLLEAKRDCQAPTVACLNEAQDLLRRHHPDLLILGLSPNPEAALAQLRDIRGLVAGRVLAVGPASDSKLILAALHAGADHYLDEAELESQLDAFLERVQGRDEVAGGQLLSLVAASGGSGSSTIAVNLAALLARQHGRSLLLDLKTGLGDLAALLDLKPTHTLADLCLNAARMDRDMFETALTRHPSGISLLAPPQRFDDIRLVTPQGMSQTLALGRAAFPYLVADLEDCYHQEQVKVLAQADVVLVVVRLDFTSLRNARIILARLDHMGISAGRVQLIINRYGQAKELPTGEVEGILGRKIAHLIPDDPKTINSANNAGIPAVLKAPGAKVSQKLAELAAAIQRQPAQPAPVGFRQLARSVNGWLSSLC